MAIDKALLTQEVIKLQNGDGKAFETVYNMTNETAYFTALKIVRNEDDAQDILQDSYIKVLEKISTLDNPEVFMSWFNMIVANNARNFLRKQNPVLFRDEETETFYLESDRSLEGNIEEDIPESDVEKRELMKDVNDLVDSLSDEKRTAVILYYYNEMPVKEIAEALNLNENTVKSRLSQARKELAKGVKELEKKNKKITLAKISEKD